jgi:small ligand-binding sensory domain FIST
MPPSISAKSFSASLQAAQKTGVAAQLRVFGRALAEAMRGQKSPSAAVVFLSGAPGFTPEVAEALGKAAPELSALVVPAAGVLDEAAEIEGTPAVAGMVWSGGRARVDLDEAAIAPTGDTRLLFAAQGALGPGVLEGLTAGCLFGAGSSAEAVYGVDRGKVGSARLASLALSGQGAPVVETSSACRTVAESFPVTDIDGRMVLELDGKPALEVLSATVGGGKHGGLILVALESPGSDARLFRPLKGIDPSRRGLVVEADLREGDRLSFAVRDAAHAKADLAEAARRAEQRALGSAPRFALYLSCAARGRSLYREPDVDVRILRKRFPKLPIAGMHSAFEIVPWGPDGKHARVQLMTGVFALFRAPS